MGGMEVTTFDTLMAGGNSGPVVIPGDPDNSTIVIRQEEGNHPGQLSPEEIQMVRDWIANGAPQN